MLWLEGWIGPSPPPHPRCPGQGILLCYLAGAGFAVHPDLVLLPQAWASHRGWLSPERTWGAPQGRGVQSSPSDKEPKKRIHCGCVFRSKFFLVSREIFKRRRKKKKVKAFNGRRYLETIYGYIDCFWEGKNEGKGKKRRREGRRDGGRLGEKEESALKSFFFFVIDTGWLNELFSESWVPFLVEWFPFGNSVADY